jgi:hypothetical protein
MNMDEKKPSSLEREVIVAVIILYLMLCGALLGIHYLQPAGVTAVTSSKSPSHAPQNVTSGGERPDDEERP